MDKENLEGRSPIRSVNPATGEIIKVFETMSEKEIDQKLHVAEQRFYKWREVPFAERAKILHNVASIFRKRKDEMARLSMLEMGKLHREGIIEVSLCANIFDYYADNGESFLADEPIKRENGISFISYEPLGVILSIQPWNFPYSQLVRNVAPIIMSGNTIVVKHASNVPQCAAIVEEIFREAGAPEGVYTNLYLPGARASQLAEDRRIKAVTLTGSKNAGSSLASVAGKNIKKSVLELGGSDPFIVLEDADFDKAVELAAMNRLRNAGQVCTSPKRVIVVDQLADKFIARIKEIFENVIIGDPSDEKTQLAPLSSEAQLETVLRQIEDSVNAGAKLVYGGKRLDRKGSYMQPAILTDIKPGMVAYSDEIFGPVACIFKVKDEDEAIRIANDNEYGLGATIFSRDERRAVRLARRIESGMVGINRIISSSPELPFGGVKNSGYGRELSYIGIHEFVNKKLIRIDNT